MYSENMTYRIACAAPNCKMRTYDFSVEQSKLASHNYIVSFHKFPANEERRKLWINAANSPGWNPPKDGSVCSLHFRDDCFNANQLYDFAIPTIFFDDFRGYLKEIIAMMNLNVSFDSDHEDILSKSLKNISPVVSDSEEIIEYDISVEDDDFDVECQVVDSVENDNRVAPDTNKLSIDYTSRPPKISSSEVTCNTNPVSKVNSKTVNKTKKSSVTRKPKPKSALINENPSSKLLSLLNDDSFTKMRLIEPAKPDLVHQLINIVRMANSHAQSLTSKDNASMGTYVVTTKQEITSSAIQHMETKDIVSMITKTIQSIKDGSFVKPDNMTIICSSPTIFLIKNVVVKNFDRNMNSVYVITVQNLTDHLRQLSDKMNPTKVPDVENVQMVPKLSTALASTCSTASGSRSVTSTLNQTNPPTQSAEPTLPNTKIIINKIPPVNSNHRTIVLQPTISDKKMMLTPVSGKAVSFKILPKILPKTTPMITSKSVETSKLVSVVKPNIISTAVAKSIFLTQPKLVPSGMTIPKPAVIIKTGKISNIPVKASHPSPLVAATSQSSTSLNGSSLPTQSATKSAGTVTLSVPSCTSAGILKSAIALGKIVTSAPFIGASNNTKPVANRITVSAMPQQLKPPPPIYTISDCSPSDTDLNTISNCSPSVTISRTQTSGKRKVEDVTIPPSKKLQIDHLAYLSDQKREIKALEDNILRTERDITATRKKIQTLKKRYLSVKNPLDAKSDEQLVEQILQKYVETNAVQFFICQMKVAGKACTQYRWTEEEKLFSLSLLYKNPLDYHILFQRYTLPSDKTLNKFVSKIKRAEADSKTKL